MKKHKWWIIGITAIVVIAIGIFLAEVYLKNRIKKELQIQTEFGDTLQISKVDLGLLGGWMDINDLVIRWNIGQPDTAREQLTYLIRGKIGKVQLKGLNFSKYILKNTIQIKQLMVDSSDLDFFLLKDPPANRDSLTFIPTGDDALVINVEGITLKPSRIRYFEGREERPQLEAGFLRVEATGFQYPQVEESGKFISHFNWSAEKLQYRRPDQFSDLLVGQCAGNSGDSSLIFSDLRFLPRFSKTEYSRLLKHQDSRVDISVGHGQFEGLDWLSLLNRRGLRARSFTLDSCQISVYEDSRLPVDENRYKGLYHEKLLKAGAQISIDSVRVRRSRLVYEMRPERPEAEVGFLNFSDLDAFLSNITNDTQRINKKPLLRARINTILNGESELKTYFTFDLGSPSYAFSYSGHMHGFDLPQFNTMLMETSSMKIAAGKLQHLSFEVQADNQVAVGEMKMEYSDLKIEWQENHNRLAALAQKVMMREQNPKNGNYRIGRIYYERQSYRSFWNFYLKSLLSGLNSTAMPNLFLPKELDARKEKK